METYKNLYLNPNAEAILHTFELEEMLKKNGNICCWDKLQGLPTPLQDSKMLDTHGTCYHQNAL
jgi:hypothetical protein